MKIRDWGTLAIVAVAMVGCVAQQVGVERLTRERMAALEDSLYDARKESYDEVAYGRVLREALADTILTESEKLRYRAQLEMIGYNAVGTAPCALMLSDGRELRDVIAQGRYTLLFFYDPDCDECAAERVELEGDKEFASLLNSNKLQIIFQDMNEVEAPEYDFPLTPTLMLIDGDGRVALKIATLKRVRLYFKQLGL